MKYTMRKPCDACPFLIGSNFTKRSLDMHAAGEFACHKTCEVNEDSGDYEPRGDRSVHCAGALIYLEKRNNPHQMMRICERIGAYDRTKLEMDAPVYGKPSDFKLRRKA